MRNWLFNRLTSSLQSLLVGLHSLGIPILKVRESSRDVLLTWRTHSDACCNSSDGLVLRLKVPAPVESLLLLNVLGVKTSIGNLLRVNFLTIHVEHVVDSLPQLWRRSSSFSALRFESYTSVFHRVEIAALHDALLGGVHLGLSQVGHAGLGSVDVLFL